MRSCLNIRLIYADKRAREEENQIMEENALGRHIKKAVTKSEGTEKGGH